VSPDPRAGLGNTGPAASDVMTYRRRLAERARRATEALRLYEPLEAQDEFHKSTARRRLLRAGNRAGKTLICAVECARALTGRDPYGKFPLTNGRCYAVGKDESQLGEVVHRKLFRAGAFKIIRDRVTNEWRAFRPWLEEDRDREAKAKPAPPLVPERYIKSKAWVKKAANIPEKFTLVNGWEIDFWSSNSKPPRGSDLDVVWMDEEIIDPEWYAEMIARLVDRSGWLWWGATPQTGSVAMMEFHYTCEREAEEWRLTGNDPEKAPDHREYVISLADNPHLKEKDKRLLAAGLTDEQARVRIDGNYAQLGRIMFPEYDVRCHDIPGFTPPHDWTRYTITDPGRQVCAVLFGAVPPLGATFPVTRDPITLEERHAVVTEEDEYLLLYDELYIGQCSATIYGERMAAKCKDQTFQAFYIDRHGGRLGDIGSGLTVEEQYSAALKANGVKCVATGHRFQPASDDVKGGIEMVRKYLHVRAAKALPRVFTVDAKSRLWNFKWEIERYSRKTDPAGNITDEPETRGRVHLMACLRYICAARPRYVTPPRADPRMNFAFARFLAKQRAARGAGGGGVVLGPQRD
jgi:hypothetical protein